MNGDKILAAGFGKSVNVAIGKIVNAYGAEILLMMSATIISDGCRAQCSLTVRPCEEILFAEFGADYLNRLVAASKRVPLAEIEQLAAALFVVGGTVVSFLFSVMVDRLGMQCTSQMILSGVSQKPACIASAYSAL